MNELTNEKYMTVSEVAEALSVSRDLVEKRVNELYPDKMKKGVKTYLDELEVTAIKLRISENSSLATSDDRRRLIEMPKSQAERAMIVAQAHAILEEQIRELRNETTELQIQLDIEKSWFSVKRVQTMGYLDDKDPRELWRALKDWSIAYDYQIKGIFDANYGEVKTYHRDAWKAVYGVQL